MVMILGCVLLFLVSIYFSNLYFENRRMKKLLKFNKMFHKALKEESLYKIKAVSYFTRSYFEYVKEYHKLVEKVVSEEDQKKLHLLSKDDLIQNEETIDLLLDYLDELETAVNLADLNHENIP